MQNMKKAHSHRLRKCATSRTHLSLIRIKKIWTLLSHKPVHTFFAIAENYPQLKASENFEQLQRALNETEEQLSAARRTFNACVTDYNNAVQTFPSNLLAGMFGFTRKNVFSISEQERTVPNVNNLLNQ